MHQAGLGTVFDVGIVTMSHPRVQISLHHLVSHLVDEGFRWLQSAIVAVVQFDVNLCLVVVDADGLNSIRDFGLRLIQVDSNCLQ